MSDGQAGAGLPVGPARGPHLMEVNEGAEEAGHSATSELCERSGWEVPRLREGPIPDGAWPARDAATGREW